MENELEHFTMSSKLPDKNAYKVEIECGNCGCAQKKPIIVAIGKPWHEWLEDFKYKCDNCGCEDGFHLYN